jgi:GNAT superfamily N-acetyltransferase
MTLSVSIRAAVPSDIAAINPLFEVLDEHHRIALPEVFRKPTGARREQSWLDWIIAGADGAILVAEGSDAKIIGLVVLVARSAQASVVRDARRFVEIRELVVNRIARRLGVGRSLIDASKMWARERGIWSLEVSAWSFNAETIEFYRKVGFRRTIEWFAMSSVCPPSAESSATSAMTPSRDLVSTVRPGMKGAIMHDRSANLRSFFASYVTRSGRARDPRVERAFATVMREPFVGPGPWSINIPGVGYLRTPDDDIAFIYQDTLVALDADRGINIGQPSAHARWLDALAPAEER